MDLFPNIKFGISETKEAHRKSRCRTSRPKVKTGCSTCRQRHVKCGEERPECIRCLKAGMRCVGYFSDVLTRSGARALPTRFLLPQVDAMSNLAFARPSSLLLNETEIEHRYFQHFQDQTTSDFTMNFDSSLWNRLILQTSRQEPFVRHAIIAIGAVSKSLQNEPSSKRAKEPIRSTKHQKVMANLHRKFAILEYSKSLKEMKDIITKGGFGPRQALLASLLSFCFENFLGNRPVAMYHAQAGHQILQTWMSEHPHNIAHDMGISSPAPHVIEDDLVRAFAQLDLQILTIADARDHTFHESLKHFGDKIVANMPKTFKDLNEARFYWDIVMARSYHFLLTAWEMSRSSELARPFMTTALSHTFITNSSKTLYGTPNIITDELLEQQKTYLADVTRWHRAFHPIWMRMPKTSRHKELVMATLILVNCVAVEIMVAAVAFPDQVSYDKLRTSFQQIVDLIETHITTVFEKAANPIDGGLLIDLGITCPLGVVVMRCRDRVIRRRAITILQSWFNEGPNDSVMISKVGTFMMEMEEEGIESIFIPESSRAIPTLYGLDHMNKAILMQFCQRRGGPDGGPVWREKKFDW